MKILFCGTNVMDEIEYATRDISAAGNRFQNNMQRELERANCTLDRLSYLAVPMEQKNLCKMNSKSWDYVAKQDYGRKTFFAIPRAILAFHRKMKQHMVGADAVMCYNVNYAWLNLPKLAKKRGVKSVLILADYSDTDSYSDLKSKLYAYAMKRSIRKFDVVVGLSSKIKEILKPDQEFLLMEGGIDESFYQRFDEMRPREAGPFRIMYAGLLNHVTGVDQLIDVMDKVTEQRKDIILVISGKGEYEELIREKQKTRPWLDFKGHMPYEEYIEELKRADLLVNPRNMDLPENRNNFPSKVMDYLATGKPVLSTEFAGYQRFESTICFRPIEKWSDCICHWKWDRNDYQKNREAARQFLWKTQVRRVLLTVSAEVELGQ